ncbi:MAG: tetratricopeptide repeat protein, partial [Thermoanaerobaculia bacterium]
MADAHPSPEQLQRFLRADLPSPESRQVLRHLLAGCDACRKEAAGVFTLEGDDVEDEALLATLAPGLEAAYDRAIDGAFRSVEHQRGELERERAAAEQLWHELDHHPASRQQMLVRNSARFASRALCELLLAKSQEACFEDAERAVEFADLAQRVLERVEEGSKWTTTGALHGLAARCWGTLGNAERVRGDHAAAERAIHQAETLIKAEVADPLDRARVLDWKASLRKDQRQFDAALHLLDRVIGIYRQLGQRHLYGRSLSQKATVCLEAGDAASAIALLRGALDNVDEHEDAQLALFVRHNLIVALSGVGKHHEAFALLFHTRPLYLEHGGRMDLIRLRWLEGSVAQGLGRADQAEAAFREVREAYLKLHLDYDAALVSLDLAMLYAGGGRAAEMRRLAEEMLPVFTSRRIHREALAALIVFRRAAEMEQAGVELVRKVADFLD